MSINLKAPGCGALASAELYCAEVDPSDYDYQMALKRRNAMRRRRARGVKPVAVSPHRAHNPPCAGCEFAQLCKEKALACNHFAEWSVSKRPIVKGIKKLLPSKKWMALLAEAEDVSAVRVAYYLIVDKQQTEEVNQ